MSYPLYIWLTAAVIGSALFFTAAALSGTHKGVLNFDDIAIFVFAVLISGLVSIPAYFALWGSVHLLTKTTLAIKTIKLLLALFCIVLCVLTFLIFQIGYYKKDFIIVGSYAIPLVAGVFFYKLKEN